MTGLDELRQERREEQDHLRLVRVVSTARRSTNRGLGRASSPWCRPVGRRRVSTPEPSEMGAAGQSDGVERLRVASSSRASPTAAVTCSAISAADRTLARGRMCRRPR